MNQHNKSETILTFGSPVTRSQIYGYTLHRFKQTLIFNYKLIKYAASDFEISFIFIAFTKT